MSELEKNMSLDDRINNLIKNVEQHKDVLYEDEEDQISEEEIKRIENDRGAGIDTVYYERPATAQSEPTER